MNEHHSTSSGNQAGKANGHPQNGEAGPMVNNNKFTVCLLDDDPSVLRATSRLLSSAGWNVETFTDPIAFLRHAQNHQPPVAVIDIRMPVMNGLEVQSRLRSSSPETQVIILTSNDDPSIRSEAMGGGASAFLVKPVDDNELIAGIESAASRN